MIRHLVCLLMATGALQACAAGPRPPCIARIHVTADARLNPGPDGVPLPAVLRVRALDAGAALPLDFNRFWDQEAGDNAVFPGESQVRDIPVSENANRLMAAVHLRQPGRFRWMSVHLATAAHTLCGRGPVLRVTARGPRWITRGERP